MRGVMRTLGSTVPLHDSDSDIKIKLERNMKRVIAKQILKKSKHNRSKAAEVFGLNNSYLYRLIKKKDVDCLRQKSTGTVKRHHEVKDFYLSPENSTQLSQKNKVKNDMPVFVLKETLDVLYTLYQSKVDMPVSRSLFKKLRPKNVRLAKSEIFNQCLCEVCENIQLMLKTINMYIPVSKRLRSNRNACRAMLCEEDGGSFSKLDCITGDCLLCGSKKLHSYLTLEGQELTVSWKKWENNQQTKKKMLVEKSATFQEMIQEFEKEMESYPLHQFRAQWQLKEFAQVRANPPAESCISVLDFAENYRCLLQDEIQSAHWSYSQVTLHPFVNYYSCHDCNKIITDVITIVSDDLKHDTEAVRIFSHKVYGHLSSKGYVFKRIIQWTDGCGAQYKCKDAFRDLTQMDEWARNVERNFFGSRHGKNACDGESAVTKRTVTQAVKSRRVVVQSAIDFFAFCKTHLVKPDYIDDVCCHYRRNFILVESAEISREDRDELYPVKGTRNLHNVKSNGARKLLVRSLSCFCHGCETDQNCFNNSHVQPWMDVELKVKHKKHDDRVSPSTTVVEFMEREESVTNDAQNLDQADDPEMQTFFVSLVDVVSEILSHFTMPRNYKSKPGSRPYKKTSVDVLNKAMEEVRSGSSQRVVCLKYDIGRSTLQYHLKANENDVPVKLPGRPTVLSSTIERSLVRHLTHVSDWGFPFDAFDLRMSVKRYLDKEGRDVPYFHDNLPGDDWYSGFVARHKNDINTRLCQNISKKRAGVNPDTIKTYFEELGTTLNGVPPTNIINYDETNLTDDPGRKKMIFTRGVRYPERIMDSTKSSTSLMLAGSASGEILPLYVVYKAEHLWSTWTEGGPHGCRFNRSKSGWFDNVAFVDWFNTIILPYCRRLEGRKVIIGDNLSSHFNDEIIASCGRNNISFVCLPPNSTHLCQPLDVAFFAPMKAKWRAVLTEYKLAKSKSAGTVPKEMFAKLLKKLMAQMPNQSENLVSGFRKCGIFPCTSDPVLKRLPQPETTNEEADNSLSEIFINHLKQMRNGDGGTTARGRRRRLNVVPGRSIGALSEIELPSTSRVYTDAARRGSEAEEESITIPTCSHGHDDENEERDGEATNSNSDVLSSEDEWTPAETAKRNRNVFDCFQ